MRSPQDRTTASRDDYPTPQWLSDRLAEEFSPGGFDLDPAASADNAKAPRFYTEEDDGLVQPWKGKVFMNPPYDLVGVWMAKAAAEVEAGRADLVVCLVPARPGTGWYDTATRSAFTRVLPGRRVWPRANFASAIIVLGHLAGRHGTVTRRCSTCKQMFWPARSDGKTCSDRCRKSRSRSQVNPANRDVEAAA